MPSPTLKALLASSKSKCIKFVLDPSNIRYTMITMIGKGVTPVSVLDDAPSNTLTHRKFTSFASLVQMVSTCKGCHSSSELIHFISSQLPVDANPALQEDQSVPSAIHDCVFHINHLEPLTFLDSKMDTVATKMSNDSTEWTQGIKMLCFGCHVKGSATYIRIGDGVELNIYV
eukprot:8962024-Ditylum_brightwellii.AAC.1